MKFQDRAHAGRQLSAALSAYKDCRPLVLAIPRGAFPIGKAVAEALGGDLDVIQTRKIGAPGQAEFAIAAIDETGWVYRNPDVVLDERLERHIAHEREQQLRVMDERRHQFTPGKPMTHPANRIVIVVDDGMATGSTMMAAVHAVRAKRPARLICAVPVASEEAIERIRPYVDDLVCVHTPHLFQAVGQFYERFDEVDFGAVVAMLRESRQRGAASSP